MSDYLVVLTENPRHPEPGRLMERRVYALPGPDMHGAMERAVTLAGGDTRWRVAGWRYEEAPVDLREAAVPLR